MRPLRVPDLRTAHAGALMYAGRPDLRTDVHTGARTYVVGLIARGGRRPGPTANEEEAA